MKHKNRYDKWDVQVVEKKETDWGKVVVYILLAWLGTMILWPVIKVLGAVFILGLVNTIGLAMGVPVN